MTFWHLEYYELGSSIAYLCETYFSAEKKDLAVARHARLGGDDVLKITTRSVPDLVQDWLKVFRRSVASRYLKELWVKRVSFGR